MEQIKSINNRVMVDLMVRCMLNPNNSLYIGKVTLESIQTIVNNFANQDEELVDIYWTAFGIALAKQEQSFIDYVREIANKHNISHSVCPKCGCSTYVEGCACPNCDCVED